jgi:hypothetical protein
MRASIYASDPLVVVEDSVSSSVMRRTSSLLAVNLLGKGCRCGFELALDAPVPRCFWTMLDLLFCLDCRKPDNES